MLKWSWSCICCCSFWVLLVESCCHDFGIRCQFVKETVNQGLSPVDLSISQHSICFFIVPDHFIVNFQNWHWKWTTNMSSDCALLHVSVFFFWHKSKRHYIHTKTSVFAGPFWTQTLLHTMIYLNRGSLKPQPTRDPRS